MMALIRHEARLGPGVDLSQGAPWGLVQSWVRTAVNSKALAPHRCPPPPLPRAVPSLAALLPFGQGTGAEFIDHDRNHLAQNLHLELTLFCST